MTDEQPNTLRIADYLDDLFIIFGFASFRVSSDELRRLHGENEELRDKLAQPKPEPVAWTTDLEFDYDTEIIPAKEKGRLGTSMNDIPLYTEQPKKEWVDLTAAEIKILRNASNNDREFAALVIARFKEKNGG